jgi:D-methionine transport system ATP-binding protein
MGREEGRLRKMLLRDGEADRAFIKKYQHEALTRCVA